jgi:hypothetical protein
MMTPWGGTFSAKLFLGRARIRVSRKTGRRLSRATVRRERAVDVGELGVAVRVAAALDPFAVGVEALHRVAKQLDGHGRAGGLSSFRNMAPGNEPRSYLRYAIAERTVGKRT